jgi:hypothetical protein
MNRGATIDRVLRTAHTRCAGAQIEGVVDFLFHSQCLTRREH